MECRIEGALGHLEDVLGDLLDALRDGPAVLRLERERSEDQQIERALREIDAFATHEPVSPFALLQEHSVTTPVEVQGYAAIWMPRPVESRRRAAETQEEQG